MVLDTGSQFNNLTIVKFLGSVDIGHKHTMNQYLCHCSCGCSKMSQAEIYVHSILSKFGFVKDVDYFSEKTFPDLIGVNGGKLRFDFMVHLSDGIVFIECQGKQHYKSVDYFGGDESFALRVQNDNLKREWINKHGYKLIEIPYTVHSYDDFLKIFVKEHIVELTN